MIDIVAAEIIIPLAESRVQAICGMTISELHERLPRFDSYLPDEIRQAATELDGLDHTATAVVEGYRAAIDTAGVRARRIVKRQLAAVEDALAAGKPCVAAETGRLGQLVCRALDNRDQALRELDELLRTAADTLADRP